MKSKDFWLPSYPYGTVGLLLHPNHAPYLIPIQKYEIRLLAFQPFASSLMGLQYLDVDYSHFPDNEYMFRPIKTGTELDTIHNPVATTVYRYLSDLFTIRPETSIKGIVIITHIGAISMEIWNEMRQEVRMKKRKQCPNNLRAYAESIRERFAVNKDTLTTDLQKCLYYDVIIRCDKYGDIYPSSEELRDPAEGSLRPIEANDLY